METYPLLNKAPEVSSELWLAKT